MSALNIRNDICEGFVSPLSLTYQFILYQQLTTFLLFGLLELEDVGTETEVTS